MNMKITLSVLFEALIILGHDRVWMEESEFEHIYGYGCYREIHTWDDRTVAGGMMLMTHGICPQKSM